MREILTYLIAAANVAQGPTANDAWVMGLSTGVHYVVIVGPMLMILVFAVALSVFLARWLGRGSQAIETHDSPRVTLPLDILKERLARGEIDKEEFEELSRLLIE